MLTERPSGPVRRPSIRSLARLAHVSPSTVSRALSGKDGVSEATRAHILRLAAMAGLITGSEAGGRGGEGAPAAQGPGLKAPAGPGRDAAITLLVDARGNPCLADLDQSPFFGELLGGLSVACRDFGVLLHVERIEDDGDLAAFFARVDAGKLASCGVVWLGYQALRLYEPWIAALKSRAMPVVLCDHDVAGLGCDAVLSDNIGGALAVARHVASLGHRRVAILQQALPSVAAAERTLGSRAGLLESGVAPEDIAVVEAPPSFQGGYGAADELFESGATAILCGNDVMAMGVLRRAHERGIAVPGEISVAGFDDIATSAQISPALTTVRVDKRAIGYEAVRRLLARVQELGLGDRRPGSAADGGGTPVRTVVPTELVVRESTGVVAAAFGRPAGRAAGR